VVQPDQDSELRGSIESNVTDSKRLPNLIFTSDSRSSISKADIVFLAVNTPTKTFGLGAGKASNMTALDEAVKEVAIHAKPSTIIVEKSTVPCGTAQRIRQMVNLHLNLILVCITSIYIPFNSCELNPTQLETLRPSMQFEVLSNPEFLSEGTAIENLMRPDRVLIGSSSTPSGRLAATALSNVYASWIPRSRILSINAWSSELAKLVVNAMLAQRISSINSISAICEVTGADVDEIAKSIGLDPRIGPQFLKAGLGFGGSCFRKDISSLSYLAESLGLDEVGHYWSQINSINELQRHRFARKVIQHFNENLVGKKIALLGFAFKKNTGDTRESLAVDVIKTLLEERPAEIAIFDPCCREADILREIDPICMSAFSRARDDCIVKVYPEPYQACSQANAVLVITDCDQFRNTPSKNTTQRTRTAKPSPSENENTYIFKADPFTPTTDSESTMSLSYQYNLPPPPPCASDCPDCAWDVQSEKPSSVPSQETLEWARIAYGMKEPKWVFDGRAMLDVAGLERLGVNVDQLGRRRAEDAEGC
jgi:UDPglucose 6-dehydrogenase